MNNVPRYTLNPSAVRDWELIKDDTGEVVNRFPSKEAALRESALEKALGPQGGSVRIRRLDGTFDEERTYPRHADPERFQG